MREKYKFIVTDRILDKNIRILEEAKKKGRSLFADGGISNPEVNSKLLLAMLAPATYAAERGIVRLYEGNYFHMTSQKFYKIWQKAMKILIGEWEPVTDIKFVWENIPVRHFIL